MWHPIGFVALSAFASQVVVGRFAGELPNGLLHLRMSYAARSSPDPLSFLIVDFLDDSGVHSLGSEKWWPRPEPGVVRLGPSIGPEAEGRVLLRPRSYNMRWLEAGVPLHFLPVFVEAWLPQGTSSPQYLPTGFDDGFSLFDLSGVSVGPAGAQELIPRNG